MTIPGTGPENALLRGMWEDLDAEGWWLLEVPIGGDTGSHRTRRIDAVRLPHSPSRLSPQRADLDEFANAVEGAAVQIIEVKPTLDTAVIGQLLCGVSLFTDEYPLHGPLGLVALVGSASDASLRWYCNYERITVIEGVPLWNDGSRSSIVGVPARMGLTGKGDSRRETKDWPDRGDSTSQRLVGFLDALSALSDC